MTHLSTNDLLRWRDTPSEADRETVVGHLAVCDRCAAVYAELVRTRPLEEIAPTLDVAPFAAVGVSQVRPVTRQHPATLHGGLRWVLATAAGLLLALLTWQIVQGQRLRSQLDQAEVARTTSEQQLAQQSRDDQARIQQLARELEAERTARTRLEQELAQRDTARGRTTLPGPIVSLVLTLGRVRSAGDAAALTIPRNAESVRLVLNLPPGRRYASGDAAIVNADGRRVWSGAANVGGESSATVIVPARVLPEDDYTLELSGTTASGTRERAGEYYFTVQRK